MSRYVQVELDLDQIDSLDTVLPHLELAFHTAKAGAQVMLRGNMECAGEPVDVRFDAGTLGSVDDFGLLREDGGVRLVCGEHDRDTVQTQFMPRFQQAIAVAVAQQRAEAAGLKLEQAVEPDGTRRIRLRPR